MSGGTIVAIVGATATGKSALAVELARRLDGEVINADALQVYRGLDIGTAKPSAGERAAVPHHLIDILDPAEPYSAGRFAALAREAIEAISGRGAVPFVVGGSGLYQRALFEGLADVPAVPPAVRAQLEAELRERGLDALFEELREVDPEAECRLQRADTQRILRALEIYRSTGATQAEWWRRHGPGPRLEPIRLGLTVPRRLLYDRIEARIGRMLERGWLNEIESLLRSGVPDDAPAFQAIGYRQLLGCLRGETTLSAAAETIAVATRRYAKRQETWFRRETIRWLDARDPERLLSEALRVLSRQPGGCGEVEPPRCQNLMS